MAYINNDIAAITAFIIELDKLKAVLRRSRPVGLERYENSAEHSWHVAMLALSVSPYAPSSLDTHKVIKMLLVHDIVEIDAGDHYLYGGQHDNFANELVAANRLFAMLPKQTGDEWLALWQEFEARQTAESRFAKALDRTLPLLQNLATEGRGWLEHGITLDQVLQHNRVIADGFPELWEHLQQRLHEGAECGFFATTAN